MSARNYLALCKAVVAELGIQGGNGPASVLNQTRELKNIVDWTAEADLYIQQLWTDWKFLWTEQSIAVGAGLDTFSTSAPIGFPDEERGLIVGKGTSSAYRVKWMPYEEFFDLYEMGEKQANTRIANWTLTPDGRIKLSHLTPSGITQFYAQYHRKPYRMIDNTDLSPIPDTFDRIIVVRTKITYAEREDAPEIMSGASAEYADLLEKLEAFQLPKHRHGRTSRNVGLAGTVE